MSLLTFSLRHAPAQTVDLSPLVPDKLAGKSREEIARIDLVCGNRRLRVAELFDLDGEDSAAGMAIRGSTDLLSHIGARMERGAISVEGGCGPYTGLAMRGGEIVIHGDAGAFAGSGMRAGMIEIRGNAGDFIGGALPGDKQGMRGGTIVIGGNAGDRVRDHLAPRNDPYSGKRGCVLRLTHVGWDDHSLGPRWGIAWLRA